MLPLIIIEGLMRPLVRLIIRANNQSEFIQMTFLGGENGGLVTGNVGGMESDAFALAKS